MNKFGETYCYSLSKFLKSGLPIIYNNIGAFKERIPIKEYYFKVFDSEKDIILNSTLENKFIELLDYIISYTSVIPYRSVNLNDINLKLIVPDGYKNILKNTNRIKTYCIYFPQFHSIKENNLNYYDDFTDITNLDLLIKEQKENTEKIENQYTPSTSILPINNILDYDLLKNNKLIQAQIDLLTYYDISGFAIYYYWFSKNTITSSFVLMGKY